MTKQEYNEKRTELLQTCATENDYYVARDKLREEYIASLESENAALTAKNARQGKAIDKAIKTFTCLACWRNYLRGTDE